MRLIDTHCHINFSDEFPDPDAAIAEAAGANVDRLIAIGCDERTSRNAVALAERHRGVFAVVGVHPNSSVGFDDSALDWIRELASHPKTVAIGEIGLDYHWDFATPDQQAEALSAQWKVAAELDMPVVLHCRKAYPDLLAFLESRERRPSLFHCFSGGEADAERASALDAWFGFDGPLTYKNAHELRRLASTLPRDRIVIETDSPYLTPEPFRGKPNRPAWVELVCRALAGAWGVSVQEAAATTTANAERFFRLPV